MLSVQTQCSLRFGLPDNLLQQVDVIGEGLPAGGSQGAGGEGSIVLEGFGHRQVAGLLKGADMGCEIAVGHTQPIAQLGERHFRRGGEHGHDRQPPLLVDDTIELEKGFRVHGSFLRCSVK